MTNPTKQRSDDKPERPSQAEGDRATVEENLREKGRQGTSAPQGERRSENTTEDQETPGRPSQAEGDRATVEENLRKQR